MTVLMAVTQGTMGPVFHCTLTVSLCFDLVKTSRQYPWQSESQESVMEINSGFAL